MLGALMPLSCRRVPFCLAALLVPWLWAARAGAQEDVPQRAIELHDEAQQLYAIGRYREAIQRLDEAVTLDPDGKLLYYNLGVIHERLGETDEAIRNYKKCLELETVPNERESLLVVLKRLYGLRQAGELPASRPPPPKPSRPPPHPLRPWIWASAGVTVGFAALGAIFAARTAALRPSAEPTTGNGVSVDDLQRQNRQAGTSAIVAEVCFGVAGAAALSGISLAIVATSGKSPPAQGKTQPRAALAPVVAPVIAPGFGGGVARWQF